MHPAASVQRSLCYTALQVHSATYMCSADEPGILHVKAWLERLWNSSGAAGLV